MKVCIATTTRGASARLESFIRHHLSCGFSPIFLFFDDPRDPGARLASAYPDVHVTVADGRLRQEWLNCHSYAMVGSFVTTEVMARQILNVEVAMSLAERAGCDWLLHLDDDELFLSSRTASSYFASQPAEVSEVILFNHEAIPETPVVQDCFREVTLFKYNPLVAGQARMALYEELATRPYYFTAYLNGKAAARVPGMPHGVHRFCLPPGCRRHEDLGGAAALLHYPHCGLRQYVTKYRILKNIADHYFGFAPIEGFHRHSLELARGGDPRLLAESFAQHIMMDDRLLVQRLLDQDVLTRIEGPSLTLAERLAA